MENYSLDCWSGGSECADDSGFSSPGQCYDSNSSRWCQDGGGGSGRRGRPKAAMITSLMKEGAESRSAIRCEICSRVFPRDKSLQAHLRVHTGERPYSCDYPGCVRKFKQSGQLKTHQRLHTGERPFLCSSQGCNNRFTHANRHCTLHPSAALIRCDNFTPYDPDSAPSQEIRHWLLRYMSEKREGKCEKKCNKTNERLASEDITAELSDMTNLQHAVAEHCDLSSRISNSSQVVTKSPRHNVSTTPLRSPSYTTTTPPAIHSTLRYDEVYWSESYESSCQPTAWSTSTPLSQQTACRPPVKSLFADSPSPTIMLSPRKRELPKKRWLRIARREEESSANSRRPTVLRYLATSLALNNSGLNYTDADSADTYNMSADDSTLSACDCLCESSPLLSRLLTTPHNRSAFYMDEPLATPLPHD